SSTISARRDVFPEAVIPDDYRQQSPTALPNIRNIQVSLCSRRGHAMQEHSQHAATRLAIAVALASLTACGGSSPAAPTTPSTPAPANIAGPYDLTLIASSTCSENLPAATRTLKYVANITQTGTLNTLFIVTLSGDVVFGEVVISGGISGQEIKIATFSFSEKTTGGGIALVATGTATVA